MSCMRGAATQPQSQALESPPVGLGGLVAAGATGCIVTDGSHRTGETVLLKTLHRNIEIQNYLHFNTTI